MADLYAYFSHKNLLISPFTEYPQPLANSPQQFKNKGYRPDPKKMLGQFQNDDTFSLEAQEGSSEGLFQQIPAENEGESSLV
jgi:hypothetical protein